MAQEHLLMVQMAQWEAQQLMVRQTHIMPLQSLRVAGLFLQKVEHTLLLCNQKVNRHLIKQPQP
jgi:hypothetical protein